MNCSQGVVVVGRSRGNADENRQFELMVGRVASRLEAAGRVVPALIGGEVSALREQVDKLVAAGVTQITVQPEGLEAETVFMIELSGLLWECQQANPSVTFKLITPRPADRCLEDSILERLWGVFAEERVRHGDCSDGRRETPVAVRQRVGGCGCLGDEIIDIMRRVAEATGDFSYATSMRFHRDAVECGKRALEQEKVIWSDSPMLAAGLDGCDFKVVDDDGDLAKAGAGLAGSIVVVGESPQVLETLLAVCGEPDGPEPALVIGLPAGFSGAVEAKLKLTQSRLRYISNVSPRGGVGAVLAVLKGLAEMQKV